MKITADVLIKIDSRVKDADKLADALNEYLPKWGIVKAEEVAMFLAQVCHESAGFSVLSENLNYSAKGLRNTWSSRFPNDLIASKYARQPRAIANKVYADRMGNGSEASGDGWLFRGRGFKQLTFKNNYIAFEKDTGIPVTKNPDLLMQIPEAVISACWYWAKGNPTGKSLNLLCPDVKKVTKAINGGYIGLAERTKLYEKIKPLITALL